MIKLYIGCLLLGIIVGSLWFGASPKKRVTLAVCVSVVAAVILTAAVIIGGDKPTPGATTVDPASLKQP